MPYLFRNTFLWKWKLLLILTIFITNSSHAQYFGQNKVRYKTLDFKVYQTPHFELYYYLKNDSLVKRMAQESEIWYHLHQQLFHDKFKKKNPLIIYNNHPDFQQTTAIDGDISVGTGGVTEALKNRVVMPIMELNQQTRHVLGHELVHAFQYHSLLSGDSTTLENINNLPLWMVEGMAEYLSIGKVDAYTAMWMRDAMINKDIPSIRDLTLSNKYFPYRYGQAFWAFIGATYQDSMVVRLFKETARYGLDFAIAKTFGFDENTLSALWKNAIISAYKPFLKDTNNTLIGNKIIHEKNAGNMNVAPAISPDGKYVVFLSERDLFSIDLFLADARTGNIIRKLSSKTSNSHIDEFNFIESAGAWSPDSKKFAFSIFSKGRNQLLIIDIQTGKTLSTEPIPNVEQFSNLSWSPRGQEIALSGLANGQSDLYLYNLETKKVTQLTNDVFSDYQPHFSSDGQQIVFSTDRDSFSTANSKVAITYNLAILNLTNHQVKTLPVFKGANNLNPQFSPNDSLIYFLSNRDGFRNLYRYHIKTQETNQLTHYFTGISGITEYSPALSLSRNQKLIYSFYNKQKYTLYAANINEFHPLVVSKDSINFDAATLPPIRTSAAEIIKNNLDLFGQQPKISNDSIKTITYKPKFKLDYIAGNGMGISVSRFGTGLNSGIQGIFSDILGRNKILAALAVNGQIYDFGAQIAYINQKNRINWGVGISHIPYQRWNRVLVDPIPGTDSLKNLRLDLIRTFEEQVSIFSSYPISKVNRFEIGTALSYYSYRIDSYNTYYDKNGNLAPPYSDQTKMNLSDASNQYGISFKSFVVNQISTAFVGDNSYSGVTATPLEGFRYRFGIEQMFGGYNISAFTLDYRKYYRIKPFTFAFRSYTYQRYGNDNNKLYPLYLGYPFFIRGYEGSSFYNNVGLNDTFSPNNLMGSRMALVNFEIRVPFTGPAKLAIIPSKLLFTDLSIFFDSGLAWYGNSTILFNSKMPNEKDIANYRIPVTSAGISLRINIFGALVLEPYYARPFQIQGLNSWVFGLNFMPGW